MPLTIGAGASVHYLRTYLGGGIGFNHLKFHYPHGDGDHVENKIGVYITGGFLIPLAGPLNLDTTAYYNYSPISKIGSLKQLGLRVGGTILF